MPQTGDDYTDFAGISALLTARAYHAAYLACRNAVGTELRVDHQALLARVALKAGQLRVSLAELKKMDLSQAGKEQVLLAECEKAYLDLLLAADEAPCVDRALQQLRMLKTDLLSESSHSVDLAEAQLTSAQILLHIFELGFWEPTSASEQGALGQASTYLHLASKSTNSDTAWSARLLQASLPESESENISSAVDACLTRFRQIATNAQTLGHHGVAFEAFAMEARVLLDHQRPVENVDSVLEKSEGAALLI